MSSECHRENLSSVVYFLLLPFLNICVPLIPNTLATTKIHKFVNHFGRFEKYSKKIFILAIASGSSVQTDQASTIIGSVSIARTISS